MCFGFFQSFNFWGPHLDFITPSTIVLFLSLLLFHVCLSYLIFLCLFYWKGLFVQREGAAKSETFDSPVYLPSGHRSQDWAWNAFLVLCKCAGPTLGPFSTVFPGTVPQS